MSRTIKFRAWHRKYHVMRCEITNLDGWLSDSDCIVMQYTGLKDKNGKEIYELHEVNNRWVVDYYFNRYILRDITNTDMFKEILEDEEYEITREYSPLEKN